MTYIPENILQRETYCPAPLYPEFVKLNYVLYKIDDNTIAGISEMINLSTAFRTCDEQSGSRVSYTPVYLVRLYTKDPEKSQFKTTSQTMTMEQILELYPWFFDTLSPS